MTAEQKLELIDKMAIEYKLLPYQVEILKNVLLEKQEVFIIPSRANGRTMFKRAYREIVGKINEEELK